MRMSKEEIDIRAQEHIPFISGYRSDDPLIASEILFDVNPEAGKIDGFLVAEAVFMHMNRDERPNGQRERSLSVGDLVRVGDEWFKCEAIGFSKELAPSNSHITDQPIRITMSI